MIYLKGMRLGVEREFRVAHCRARFVLTKVVLEAGQGFVTITVPARKKLVEADLIFKLDKSKIDSGGRPAVADFLKKLQVYKSMGDFVGGNKYGSVGEEELRLNDVCIARHKPRHEFVQPNTRLADNDKDPELLTYPESPAGIIASFVEKYSIQDDKSSTEDLEGLWRADTYKSCP